MESTNKIDWHKVRRKARGRAAHDDSRAARDTHHITPLKNPGASALIADLATLLWSAKCNGPFGLAGVAAMRECCLRRAFDACPVSSILEHRGGLDL
jgi:hypothetical protein